MTGLPENTPTLARQEAELADLRWVAAHLLDEHARLATPYPCLCPVCSRAGAWVKPQAAIPHPHILPRCPLVADKS